MTAKHPLAHHFDAYPHLGLNESASTALRRAIIAAIEIALEARGEDVGQVSDVAWGGHYRRWDARYEFEAHVTMRGESAAQESADFEVTHKGATHYTGSLGQARAAGRLQEARSWLTQNDRYLTAVANKRISGILADWPALAGVAA